MKLFIKLMCFLVALALVGPFFLKAPNGQPFLSLRQVLPDIAFKMPSFPSWETISNPFNEHAGKTKVYQWVAENGRLQYSNIEPEHTEYEILWLDPDTNLIQGFSADVSTPLQASTPAYQEPAINQTPMLSISSKQFKKLQEDVSNVQGLMDARNKTLESL
ncbi:MAG: hypothetical protein V7745_07840 [Pseudomonadales bacterium]